jgi:N-acetyltransferase
MRLVPLEPRHEDGLRAAAADGELWNLRVTSVPEPEGRRASTSRTRWTCAPRPPLRLCRARRGHGAVLGSTSYHDILPAVKRVEIGYTWYARRASAPMSTPPASCC